MRYPLEPILHVIFWLATAWLICSGFSITSQEIELVDGKETVKTLRNANLAIKLLIAIGLALLMFYLNTRLLTSHLRRPWSAKVPFSIALPGIAVLLYYLIERLFYGTESLPVPRPVLFGIFVFYYSISASYALFRLWLDSSLAARELQYEKKNAELQLLRSQLQPHFLFNALNNLLSMVDQARNPRLADAIDRLSSLLRFVIEGSSENKVRLAEEIQFISDYIALQELRFEPGELDLEFEVNGNHRDTRIETGIFIPFIENAFKYGTSPEETSTIRMAFDCRDPQFIRFRIENRVYHNHSESGPGTGLQAARKRLDLVYPDAYSLDIQLKENYIVNLSLLVHEDNHH